MSKLFEPSGLVLVLAGLALAQTVSNGVQGLRSASTSPRVWGQQAELAAAPSPTHAASAMDSLRNAASMGDRFAESQLVTQLLDSYERSHDSEDLLEAVQWMDRGWDSGEYQQSGVATRVFERYCGHRVLKWHPLCNAGE